MAKPNIRDFAGGAIIAGVGTAFFIGSFQYDFGALQRIGPAYFPAIMGAIAIVLGALMVVPVFAGTKFREHVAWRPLLAVVAAMAGFAASIDRLGMLPAVLIAVLLASLGDFTSRPRSTLILALVTAAGAWLIFKLGIGLPVAAVEGVF